MNSSAESGPAGDHDFVPNGPYNVSGVLFRKALAAAARAGRIASGETAVGANAKAREADDCIVAIFLAHAAVETAWHWEQLQAGVARHVWPGEFDKALASVAQAAGRPAPPGLDPALKSEALRLNAWRNVLQHGDADARARLEATGDDPPPQGLTAALAAQIVDVAKALMIYIATVTGGQDRTGPALWIDPSEI